MDRVKYYAIQSILPELRSGDERPADLPGEYSSATDLMSYEQVCALLKDETLRLEDVDADGRRTTAMKIATVLGTRPEIIRLSRVIEKLDALCDHALIHTGQNYDPNLNDIFFRDLGVRAPNHYLGAQGGRFGDQVGQILARSKTVLLEESARPAVDPRRHQ